MKLLASIAAGLLALASFVDAKQCIKRSSLTPVVDNFGANTSGTKMYIYVPAKLAARPPVIVAIHYCTGTAQAYYSGTPYAQLAEQYGFIVIYPESPYSGTCWDVSSTAALTHNGGADSNSIANMVTYTLNRYGGDESKVFVTGTNSGAMMTNVMAATYPEMFAAASVYSGVPAGCFYTGTVNGWNSTCANGLSIHTQQEWANTVFAMYPGYTGPRPKMLIFHGSADTTLYPENYNETIKEWSGVFGYDSTAPVETVPGTPEAAYTKYVYGPELTGYYAIGVGHTVPVHADLDLAWFGITA
ncbi:carbohydrate esterase family 1 protein [Coniochaeta ligniaria NRRL 30616]|uniref:Carboxylic ester hydrolase n=1 Tax=Coniochaeta ligniaria NRRL 30616 TaxID=1408157 RepID=A0A1J7J251_9PEZI|nr:carbohydrate esterase family 1 protein [Coniochaeta ligniaria NRRL 30616]